MRSTVFKMRSEMLAVVLALVTAFGTLAAGFFTPFGRVLAAILWAYAMRRFGASDAQVRTFMVEAGTNTFKPRRPT